MHCASHYRQLADGRDVMPHCHTWGCALMSAALHDEHTGAGTAAQEELRRGRTLPVALYVVPAKFSGPVCVAVLRTVNHTLCGS